MILGLVSVETWLTNHSNNTNMPAKPSRTYGKKKTNVLTSTAIFAASPQDVESPRRSPRRRHQVVDDKDKRLMSENSPRGLSQEAQDEAAELVEAIAALDLDSAISQSPETPVTANTPRTHRRAEFPPTSPSPEHASYLDALLDLALEDDLPISLESWTSILPVNSTLTKIAEASFAEVYRITTLSATSIVKIMPLKSPDDPASLIRTYASSISDVIPELRIMNTLTEIPGFVTFKGARIVTGNQSPEFVKAWEVWGRRDDYVPEDEWEWNSEFEHPLKYGEDALFLAIELGDAGEVLEDVIIDSVEKVWDAWLGAVIALARAEVLNEFEVSLLLDHARIGADGLLSASRYA